MEFAEYDKDNKPHTRKIKKIKKLIDGLYAGEIDKILEYIKDLREGFL